MISETTFKHLQSTTLTVISKLARKIWENKYIVVPAAILGYGLVKNHVSLKSLIARPSPQKTEREDEKKVADSNTDLKYIEKKRYRHRIHAPSMTFQAKFSSSITFKEEALVFDEVLSPQRRGKETKVLKTQMTDKITTDSTNSGYHSDAESMAPEDMVKQNIQRKSSNPDELFFTIFQQLK